MRIATLQGDLVSYVFGLRARMAISLGDTGSIVEFAVPREVQPFVEALCRNSRRRPSALVSIDLGESIVRDALNRPLALTIPNGLRRLPGVQGPKAPSSVVPWIDRVAVAAPHEAELAEALFATDERVERLLRSTLGLRAPFVDLGVFVARARARAEDGHSPERIWLAEADVRAQRLGAHLWRTP